MYEDQLIWQGWQCPKCKRVYSPQTPMCPYCGGRYSVSTETVTNDPEQMANKDKIFRSLVSNKAVLERLNDAYGISIPPIDRNLNSSDQGGKFIQLLLDDVLFTVSPIEKLPKGVNLYNAVTLPIGIRFRLRKYHWIPRN